MKPDIESRVDYFNKKLSERLDDGNFQVNSDVDGNFDFIIPDEDISKNISVNYTSGVTPTDEDYGDIVVKGDPMMRMRW